MARRKAPEAAEQGSVQIERDGVIHRGTYTVTRGTLRVDDGTGSKTTHVGATPAASLARLLLGELVREEAARQARGQ